jgi:hypothetical protein
VVVVSKRIAFCFSINKKHGAGRTWSGADMESAARSSGLLGDGDKYEGNGCLRLVPMLYALCRGIVSATMQQLL